MATKQFLARAESNPDGTLLLGTVTFLEGITVTQANPAVCTLTAHGLVDGNAIIITGMSEMTELNNNTYVVNQINANTFQLNDEGGVVDSSGFGAAEVTGGNAELLGSNRIPTVLPALADVSVVYDDTNDKASVVHALKRAAERLTQGL